jgi:TRAP-type mannitol/chloroaromatic compound transport system permease large subunit
MAEFIIANMAPLMFGALVVFLLLGYPGRLRAGRQRHRLRPDRHRARPAHAGPVPGPAERIFGIMANDTLLAIPFFTFMGLILERSGMAEDLLDTIGQLFGPMRGGLAYAVIFVGALLAATTGVVAASVISMGLISLPIMLRYGYDKRLAAGVIAASGTLAQIIPPSLVLIIMADQLGRRSATCTRAPDPGPGPDRPVRRLRCAAHHHQAEYGSGPAAGSPHPAWLEAAARVITTWCRRCC